MRFIAVCLLLICGTVSGQTFGLGDDEEAGYVSVSGDLFGLAATPKPVAIVPKATPVKPPIVVAPKSTAPYKSPPGYHRHVKIDGTVIEHHDSNLGDPVAHSGIVRPWPKYNGPIAPNVRVAGRQVSNCPGGVCPTQPNVGWRMRWRR